MTSKAAKLRALRIRQRIAAGRPRKEGERYPSGGIKRSETREETMSVAITARMRHHHIESVIFKGRDLSGFTLGRMYLDGLDKPDGAATKITEPELEAGMWYAEEIERYRRAVGLPAISPQAQDLLAIRGHDGDVSLTAQERGQRASKRFIALETALGGTGQGVKSTVYNVCIMDMENLRLMPPSQVRLLRRGLRALFTLRGVSE